MNPLIRVQPTKDGGRRMLTEEAKATLAAWMRLMEQRLWRQFEECGTEKALLSIEEACDKGSVLAARIVSIRWMISHVDNAFDADEFSTAFAWALEVMNGKPDDPAGGCSTGNAVGPSPGTT